jgi:hypothetical protein
MDRVLKLIYNERYHINGYDDYLLNGIHPAVIKHIKDNYTGTNVPRDVIIDRIQSVNKSDTWSAFFRAGNFIGYYVKHYPRENIVKIDEIVDDDESIYAFPVDIGGSLDSVFKQHSLHLDGVDYTYYFIDTIDPVVLNYIKTGKVKLVFNCIHDPIYFSDDLRLLEEYLNSIGISSNNIFVIAGNNYRKYFKEFPDSKLNISSGFLPLQQAGERIDNYPMITSLGYMSELVREPDLDNNQLRPKKFLCFNRNLKPHRYFLAYLALKLNLLDTSYFSFLVHTNDATGAIDHTLNFYTGDKEYAQQMFDMVPYQLDTRELPIEHLNGFATNNNKKEYYLNSYIHITSESTFSEGDPKNPFFSEKTFHPIINLQPFIYVGNPYSLKALRDLGFKTFHPIIDENYDNEEDPQIRMEMIAKEIEWFSNMSLHKVHELYISLRDILIHNQNHCKSYMRHNPFETTINKIKNHGN